MTTIPRFAELSARQRQIYDYIRARVEEYGYPPTFREIGTAFDINSPNGVACHLRALERKGVIIRHRGARCITVIDEPLPDVNVEFDTVTDERDRLRAENELLKQEIAELRNQSAQGE